MILVTGGTGFLGAHLLHLLIQKHPQQTICATKRPNSNLQLVADIAHKIKWLHADVLDTEALYSAMQGVEQVYHSAALVSFVGTQRPNLYNINVKGTANVVNAALENKVKKMVYVSSIAAIGRSEKNDQVNEQTKWENSRYNTYYGETKRLAELEVWRGAEEGLKSVIINPSVILGTGDWTSGSCNLFLQIWEGLKIYPQGGTGFVNVQDVANIAYLLMNSDIENERFIINSENWSYKVFFETIAQYLQKPAPNMAATPLLKAIGWRLEALKSYLKKREPILTRETARTSGKTYFYDNQKVCNALNYKFIPVQETIRQVCNDFLKNNRT